MNPLKELPFPIGGIYTPEQINAMEALRNAPRKITDFTTTMTHKVAGVHRRPGQPYYGSYLFPDVPPLDVTSSLISLNGLWNWIEKYGLVMAALYGTGTLIRFFIWLFELIYRLCAAPITGSLFWHIFGAIFPAVRDFLRDKWLVGTAEKNETESSRDSKANSETHARTKPPLYSMSALTKQQKTDPLPPMSESGTLWPLQDGEDGKASAPPTRR